MYVIYKEGNNYCMTNEDNYNASIRNERGICRFPKRDFSLQQVIDTVANWNIPKEQLIIKE